MTAPGSMERHPFRALWETGDLQSWSDAIAPHVVLHSPILKAPFVGREAVTELYGVLLSVLRNFCITEEFAAGDAHVFFWRGDIDGRAIEGTDLVRSDEQGRISEVRVLVRPLLDIGVFAAAVGPPLGRRRGVLRGPLLKILALPLPWILAAADALGSRLTQRPPRRRVDR